MIYDTFNPVIFDFIEEDKSEDLSILDVGCGTGRLGKAIKSKRKCFICGIELDEDAAKIAKKDYDEVYKIDLEDYKEMKTIPFQKYDYIIYGDILEHVSNPEALLNRFDSYLKEDGFIIASIPNIANWMIRVKLLFGNFDYRGGILDEGHLRFFTYKTARNLLERCGYKILKIRNNNMTKLFKILGRLWKEMFAFQFVFLCKYKCNIVL